MGSQAESCGLDNQFNVEGGLIDLFLIKQLHASLSVVTVKVGVSICMWEVPDRDESSPGIPCALKHGKERPGVRRIAKMMP